MTLFAFRLIFALDSVLASYKAMMIAEGDDSESDNLEVNDGMYLDIYLKISKSQKHFFLKLHCPQNKLNI